MDMRIQQEMPWIGEAATEEIKRVVEALYRVHQLTGAITDLDTLLTRIVEESRGVAQAEACSLLLYDEAANDLYFHVALGDSGDQEALKRDIRLEMGQGIAGTCAAMRTSINVEDASKDARVYRGADEATDFATRSLLALPMVDRDELVGVLEVVNKVGGGAFSLFDLHVMEMFSSSAASAIVNARLIEDHVRNERLAAIGQAVAGLSHYTKNIVTGLSSSAELIEMGLDAGNVEMLQRSFPVFKRATKRITNFVQDLLSFSRHTAPLREECRLEYVVNEVRDTYAELFVMKDIALEVDLASAPHSIFVDTQALYRCLLNLMTNAMDAVSGQDGRVEIHAATQPDGSAEITVRDNGPGIPGRLRERIFDPFYSTKGSGGTGLGLAVTRKILREHGGDITVEEASGGGACFRITLPPHRGATLQQEPE